tara:strand:+ start:186 stop:473 length:288 start_codon:yes stop_codon:yes gene_type:complete
MNNCVISGKVTIENNLTVNGTVYDVRSLDGLIKVLEQGNFKNIMDGVHWSELDVGELRIKELNVDNLVIVNFEACSPSILNINGTMTSINTEIIQ